MRQDTVKIAVAQFAPSACPEGNLAHIADLARTAAACGAGVVVFPKWSSCFVDPFDASLVENTENLDGPFVYAVTDMASELDMITVTALVEKADDGRRVRNAVVAVGGDGIWSVYRKLHLYDAFGQRQSDWVEPGEIAPPWTFEVHGLRFGLMTCYDRRFPEVSWTLADAGVDVVLVPAEWVRGPLSEHHGRTLLTARAIENTFSWPGRITHLRWR